MLYTESEYTCFQLKLFKEEKNNAKPNETYSYQQISKETSVNCYCFDSDVNFDCTHGRRANNTSASSNRYNPIPMVDDIRQLPADRLPEWSRSHHLTFALEGRTNE
jgi:hypothetical protein